LFAYLATLPKEDKKKKKKKKCGGAWLNIRNIAARLHACLPACLPAFLPTLDAAANARLLQRVGWIDDGLQLFLSDSFSVWSTRRRCRRDTCPLPTSRLQVTNFTMYLDLKILPLFPFLPSLTIWGPMVPL
jgi:hypothetical protein